MLEWEKCSENHTIKLGENFFLFNAIVNPPVTHYHVLFYWFVHEDLSLLKEFHGKSKNKSK